MTWRCELSGKSVQVGHKVSHSNIKTKQREIKKKRIAAAAAA